ncbi:hypothetical protein ROHU_023422 [Labeo rohita]|uniref:DDE Tnp4 domain-containing protein n=1 Tax=Labeo rohita TaxID=84645 RepID=A0A498MRT3_LABRO|nr:hypothetical protein ROHU_023422 [Labeo rohita]
MLSFNISNGFNSPEVPANSTKLGEPVNPREVYRTPPEPSRSTPGGPRQRPPTAQTLTGRSSPETGANSAKPGSKVRPPADLSDAATPGSIDPPYVRAPNLRPGPRGLKAGSTDSPRRPLSDVATPESIDPRGAEIRAPEARKAKILTGRNSPKKRANSIKIRVTLEHGHLFLMSPAPSPYDPSSQNGGRPTSHLNAYRLLATGDSYCTIAFSYHVGVSTVAGIVGEVTRAIWDTLVQDIMPVPTTEDWRSITTDFLHWWNFPNCLGSIGGKHVMIRGPDNSESLFFDYKGT